VVARRDADRIRGVGSGNGRELFVVDAAWSDRTKLTDIHDASYTPDWSPDGWMIVFSRTTRRSAFSPDDLWIVTADGSVTTRLTDTPKVDEFRADWQPVA
jgi:Tol biopolymer transport system component